jgi:hypothetical protein
MRLVCIAAGLDVVDQDPGPIWILCVMQQSQTATEEPNSLQGVLHQLARLSLQHTLAQYHTMRMSAVSPHLLYVGRVQTQ